MRYPSITIAGSVVSEEVLEKLGSEGYPGQAARDFGHKGRLREEIASAWADAKSFWEVFSRRMEKESRDDPYGTTRTRRFWMEPLLELLGYHLELSGAAEVQGRSYNFSHRAKNQADMPVYILGFGIDPEAKLERSRGGMSAHSLLQEYLNLTEEHLYALLSNGLTLRLLRDASRLVRLSYLEFDLKRMMEDELYADFAVLYRLLHASRLPADRDNPGDCFLERYHLDSLAEGARIRDGLSRAVEEAIRTFADGFLSCGENRELREGVERGSISPRDYLHGIMMVIYRILFLLVIEERDLVFLPAADRRLRSIYERYYSISSLRKRCETRSIGGGDAADLWVAMKQAFSFFEADGRGKELGIAPLAGDLFSPGAMGVLSGCSLENRSIRRAMGHLNWFPDPRTGTFTRVNYGSLNTEEFGSVYESLLEYEPQFEKRVNGYAMVLAKGTERGVSGTHYTPEELTQPLIRHSLDAKITEKLASGNPEEGLLSLKVLDSAAGSGHILLSASRRLGLELARVRSGSDQPAPPEYRRAVRDVIRSSIYGVDKNPLAVELCKVSLWLEAHQPGEPLNFLDHHIKCGDSIVGIGRKEELFDPIDDEAFSPRDDDDKELCKRLKGQNKREAKEAVQGRQLGLDLQDRVGKDAASLLQLFSTIADMEESAPEEVEAKRRAYEEALAGDAYKTLKALADIKAAQFFLSKKEDAGTAALTTGTYREMLAGRRECLGTVQVRAAEKLAAERKLFHWFLEFPEVMEAGGFDCILGNPPFLGGQKLTGSFGNGYLDYLKSSYPPAGAIDLVGFFFRRDFSLLGRNGRMGLISTNTISQGDTRKGSLAVIVKGEGRINFAIRSTPWPGQAAVSVSLITIVKGAFSGKRNLDGKEVEHVSSRLDEVAGEEDPYKLIANAEKSFQGSIVLGKGFVLEPEKAEELIRRDERNRDVLFPYLNGEDLNSRPDQSPSRWVINFFDWSEEKAREYPDCFKIVEELVKPERQTKAKDVREAPWWQFWRLRGEMFNAIRPLERVMVVVLHSNSGAIVLTKPSYVYSHALAVFSLYRFLHYAILNSSLHYEWARYNSSTIGTGLRYTPSSAFETFPFPISIALEIQHVDSLNAIESILEDTGKKNHILRQSIMEKTGLGLTKLYNQFHNQHLQEMKESEDPSALPKQSAALNKHLEKQEDSCSYNEAVGEILSLRDLHREMDQAVLSAYGWDKNGTDGPSVDLAHGFYEVDYLPENDRVRYTISPEARRVILSRLLALNHKRHEQEVQAGLVDETGKPTKDGKRWIAARRDSGDGEVVGEKMVEYGKRRDELGQGELF